MNLFHFLKPFAESKNVLIIMKKMMKKIKMLLDQMKKSTQKSETIFFASFQSQRTSRFVKRFSTKNFGNPPNNLVPCWHHHQQQLNSFLTSSSNNSCLHHHQNKKKKIRIRTSKQS